MRIVDRVGKVFEGIWRGEEELRELGYIGTYSVDVDVEDKRIIG